MTAFTVSVEGREYGRYRTPLAGMFNVRNCLGVIAASEALGLDRSLVTEALAEFKSVKRRMQVRAVIRGVTVIDDFAHHPTAVLETLSRRAPEISGPSHHRRLRAEVLHGPEQIVSTGF